MHRRIETAPFDGKPSEIWEKGDQIVSIEPWPFSSTRFDVHVEVRTVQQLTFATDRDLERCLWASPVEDRIWHFQKEKLSRSKRER
jgi:hypothetical protein